MSKEKLSQYQPQFVRDTLNSSIDLMTEFVTAEIRLIQYLALIDQNRFFIRYGYKSIRGYCMGALKLTKTQSQIIIIKIRRFQTNSDNHCKNSKISNELG